MIPHGQLRENVVTGRWVVLAPSRGERPVEWPEAEHEARSRRSGSCPFCPGNEEELPAVLWELSAPGEPGWRTRVVPNRYPAFSGVEADGPDTADAPTAGGDAPAAGRVDAPLRPGRSLRAVGTQEVLIETPRHDVDLADMSVAQAEAVVRTYRARYRVHVRGERPRHVSLFRNEGRDAGTSLVHAHAQLVATPFPPPGTTLRERRSRAYHAEAGRCLLCALPGVEPDAGARTVFRGEHVTAFVPWAAEVPLEVWIVPRRHEPSFAEMSEEEAAEVARLLVSVGRAYRERGGDPDFNLLLHSSPGEGDADPALHWFFQLRPRVGRAAGFELLTTITINASEPLGDADLIRTALEEAPVTNRETLA